MKKQDLRIKITLDEKLKEDLENLSEKSKVSKSKIVDTALRYLFGSIGAVIIDKTLKEETLSSSSKESERKN